MPVPESPVFRRIPDMSWTDFVSHMLATTHKIEKVAVLNCDGKPLAITEGLSLSELEGTAVIKSLLDPAGSITRLHIDNNFYTLFQGNDNTVVGVSPMRDRVFVAHKPEDQVVVVIAFGNTTGHGSFLFELKKNLWHKKQRQLRREQDRLSQRELSDGAVDKRNDLLENIIFSAELDNSEQQVEQQQQTTDMGLLSLTDSQVFLQVN
ncbi:uncharacterized protein LOC121375423 [Gigantopelta aegis]|uniref:uncharacterized protein LOC121375423 n=1 Tax=Gigantopelta aegis TaxID=1735272 RepID=UPI001B88E68D|nr:uncharacterized protein LOC121375423 [Gigantopelta aegis]